MKKILDWQSPNIVNIFDETNLWSAPFGRLLLENISMTAGATILDIGFGTGFPLIELSQRFGSTSTIYGIDIWAAAIERTKEKIKQLELQNINILETSATAIPLANQSIDLITSNLGVNNFEEKKQVYTEIQRVLKPNGKLCITTNPIGTFEELFHLFLQVANNMQLPEVVEKVEYHIAHRGTKEGMVKEFQSFDFQLIKYKKDTTTMRFVNAEAVLNHALIRIGFREYWEAMLPISNRASFFQLLIKKIEDIIEKEGVFRMTIPMLYLELEKV